MKKKAIINTPVIIVLVIIALIFILVAKTVIIKIVQQKQRINKIVYNVGAIKANKTNLKEIIYAQTIVEGNPQIKIYPIDVNVTGLFIRNNVKEGDFVKKDTVLAYIDRNIPGNYYLPAIVTSPIDGIVTRLYYLDKGANVPLNQPVAEVANVNSIKIDVVLSEVKLLKVKVGQPVTITSNFLGDNVIHSKIDTVSPYIDMETFSGNAVICLNNSDRKIKLGILVNVAIEVGERPAFVVPEGTVLMGQDSTYIFVNKNNTAKQVNITTGYINNGMVEILDDFKEGDEIITNGNFKLYDGAQIKVVQ